MAIFSIAEVDDKAQIRAFLETDRKYAAYALGDLEAPYAQKSKWYGATMDDALEGIALVYSGLEPAAFFLMGSDAAISAMLLHSVGPDEVYFNTRPEQQNLLETWYTVLKPTAMKRMQVTQSMFKPNAESKFPVRKLETSDLEQINALFKLDEAQGERVLALTADMVKDGFFYGIYLEENLIAAAGTHLVAKGARLAALGNVLTHPDYRSKGLGTATSNAVTAALLEAGIETVVLNVAEDNQAAIKIYERLGYRESGSFVEGQATRR